MKMTVAIPVWNQLNDSKGILGLTRYMTSDDSEIMIIDNGSTDPYEEFLRKSVRFSKLNYIRNKENVGLVKTYQQIYENCTTEYLAIVHNDTFIYRPNWDKSVVEYFENDPKLGAIGLFGAQGCGPHGERMQDVPAYNVAAGFSNMLEADIHGFRMNVPWKSAAIFDGLGMCFRMEMLKKAGGFDQRYNYHHIYDRDIALESLRHGYRNMVIDIPCHHLSGLTANRGDYQSWVTEKTKELRPDDQQSGDKFVHDDNSRIFYEKWKDVLPLYVNDDFSFRDGYSTMGEYKGDAITRLV